MAQRLPRAARAELDALAAANRGRLRPEHLIEFARAHPGSALRRLFPRTQGEAARLYWKQRAGELIRLYVVVLPHKPRPVRAFISVPTDRGTGEGSYHEFRRVAQRSRQRAEMVADCFARLKQFKDSYHYLPELVGFFKELDDLIDRHRGQLDLGAA